MARTETLILQLHPTLQPRARALLAAAAAEGIELCITDGYRTFSQQDALYEQGRTKPGPIVTRARGGGSWHCFGLAFDVAVVHEGRATWPNDETLWKRIGELGKAQGFEWGGDWTHPDRPHFEYHPGLSLVQALHGARPDDAA